MSTFNVDMGPLDLIMDFGRRFLIGINWVLIGLSFAYSPQPLTFGSNLLYVPVGICIKGNIYLINVFLIELFVLVCVKKQNFI